MIFTPSDPLYMPVGPAGILMPRTAPSSRSQITKEECAAKAERLSQLYRDTFKKRNPLDEPGCNLAAHIKAAVEAFELYKAEKPVTGRTIAMGTHLGRILDALDCLDNAPKRKKYLRELASGSIDSFDRLESHAKNFFWEMEVCTWFLQRSFDAALKEPPDIVVTIEGLEMGVACKKIYSERQFRKRLRQGIRQLAKLNNTPGIVAMNLDDIQLEGVPAKTSNKIRKMPPGVPADALGKTFFKDNDAFLGRQKSFIDECFQESPNFLAVIFASHGFGDVGGGAEFVTAFSIHERQNDLDEAGSQLLTKLKLGLPSAWP